MRRTGLVFFIILVLSTGCGADGAVPPPGTPQPTRVPGPWRIMPLGDSLTDGFYPNGHHSYRGYLETQLRAAGYDFDFVGTQWGLAHGGTDYEHEGHGGFTIGPDKTLSAGWPGNIYARMDYYLKTDPDIILVLIGINDMFAEDSSVNPTDADEKLGRLMDHILEIDPAIHIFVASLAPVNWDRAEPWPEYEAVNAMAEKLGNADPQDQIYFVNLNRTLTPLMSLTDYSDGVHFSESGARKIAQVWFDALQKSRLLDQ
jgi:lysophospholipase L1-like esterase